MSKKPDTNSKPLPEDRHSRARRRLLKSVAAGGAVVTVKNLPEKWAKPALDATLLPAHAVSTCEAQTLTCTVTGIEFEDTGTALPSFFGQSPPLTGDDVTTISHLADPEGCPTISQWDRRVDAATLSLSATVTPPCTPVDLDTDISGQQDEFDIDSGGAQSGVVDPNTGEVSFDQVVVGIALPNPFENTDPNEVGATVDLNFATPGVPECVISITFAERTAFNCGG